MMDHFGLEHAGGLSRDVDNRICQALGVEDTTDIGRFLPVASWLETVRISQSR